MYLKELRGGLRSLPATKEVIQKERAKQVGFAQFRISLEYTPGMLSVLSEEDERRWRMEDDLLERIWKNGSDADFRKALGDWERQKICHLRSVRELRLTR